MLVTTTSWDLSDLENGAQVFAEAGGQLRSLAAAVQQASPAMYGSFVANAAALTEPATSQANRHLLTAMSGSVTDIGVRLRSTEAAYRAVEETNEALVREITSALEEPVQ